LEGIQVRRYRFIEIHRIGGAGTLGNKSFVETKKQEREVRKIKEEKVKNCDELDNSKRKKGEKEGFRKGIVEDCQGRRTGEVGLNI